MSILFLIGSGSRTADPDTLLFILGHRCTSQRLGPVGGTPAMFRTLVHEGGTIERWQQPELLAWEVPKRNPHERRPRAPDYWEPEAAAEIAELTAERDDGAAADIAA